MKYELHAEYHLHGHYRHVQQSAIDFLTDKVGHPPGEWAELAAARDMDMATRRQLLAQTQVPPAPYKDYARVGSRKEKGGVWQAICEGVWERFFKERLAWMENLGLVTPSCVALEYLSWLPRGSFFIRFTFLLESPYISRDDAAWDVWDNPVKKEWVFKVPYVAPSQWKGALRAAMRQERGYTSLEQEQNDAQMVRLFGNIKGEEEHGMLRAGRLHFYPTYFDRIGLEVINPHDRETGAGEQPIYFECVPQNTKGEFALLYVPPASAGEQEALDDLQAVAEGIRAMMTRYGFGAKTSSGFGVARESVADGLLTIRAEGLKPAPEPAQTMQPDQAVSLPRYLEASGQLHTDLRAADGSLVAEEEYRRRIEGQGKKYAKKERQLYRKAKAWWEREGKALSEGGAEPESEQPAPPEAPMPTWLSWPFDSFEELISQAGQVADQLTQGGAA